jgi:hypothetical protein
VQGRWCHTTDWNPGSQDSLNPEFNCSNFFISLQKVPTLSCVKSSLSGAHFFFLHTMGIIYRYLSSGLSRPSLSADAVAVSDSSRAERLTSKVYRLFPSAKQKLTKEEELSLTCINSHDVLYNVSFALHVDKVIAPHKFIVLEMLSQSPSQCLTDFFINYATKRVYSLSFTTSPYGGYGSMWATSDETGH